MATTLLFLKIRILGSLSFGLGDRILLGIFLDLLQDDIAHAEVIPVREKERINSHVSQLLGNLIPVGPF